MNRESARQWTIRAAVLLVLGALGFWIANKTYWEDTVIRAPLKGEAATNPQYAVKKFFEALGIEVVSRQSLDVMPPAEAALILNSWHWDLVDARRRKIEAWVRAGGRLIVDPSVVGVFMGLSEFSGIEHKNEQPKAESEEAEEDQEDTDSADEEPNDTLLANAAADSKCELWKVAIDEQHVSGSFDSYSLCKVFASGWLESKSKPVWALRDDDGMQAIRVRVGAGYVTVLNHAPFQNRLLRDVERGALLVATTQLRYGDQVWLLTEADHPSILVLAWRYGAPVVILFLLYIAALCWRNAVRFGPLRAPPERARRSLAEQIRGTSGFILRLGGAHTLYAAQLRAVRELARRRIAHFDRSTPEQQLEALVQRTGVDRDELRQALLANPTDPTRFAYRSRSQLLRAIALLETVRRVLAHDTFASSTPIDQSSKAPEATHAN